MHALLAARPRDPVQKTGISSLPNELLAYIFEEVVPQTKGFTAISETLSHVCRRWRLVILDLPNLWAEAGFHLYPDENIACLERSKDAPLMVDIFIAKEETGEHVDTIVSHAKRWGRLAIEIGHQETCRDFLSDMDAQHATLDFPLLKDLEIEHSIGEMDEDLEGNLAVMFSKWNMPNLWSLDMKGVLFSRQIPLDVTFGTNLVRCSFQFDGEHGARRILVTCLDFLRQHPRLEEFRLSLPETVEDWVWGSSFIPATLPNLRTLLVRLGSDVSDSEESLNSMALFMKALDMPCLSKVVISLDDCMQGMLMEWINVLFPKPSYPSLADLSIQVLPRCSDSLECVKSLLKRTPNVCSLNLFTPTIPLQFYRHEPKLNLPHLRRVALMPCNSIHASDISINKFLKLDGRQRDSCWGVFEGLDIVQHAIRQSQPTTEETSQSYKLAISSSCPDLMSW